MEIQVPFKEQRIAHCIREQSELVSCGLYLALPIEVETNQLKDQIQSIITLIPLQFHG